MYKLQKQLDWNHLGSFGQRPSGIILAKFNKIHSDSNERTEGGGAFYHFPLEVYRTDWAHEHGQFHHRVIRNATLEQDYMFVQVDVKYQICERWLVDSQTIRFLKYAFQKSVLSRFVTLCNILEPFM